MLVLPIPKNLHKLFQNRSLTSITSLGELRRVMEMAENLAIVFVVTILRAKDSRAYGASEVVDVIFPI